MILERGNMWNAFSKTDLFLVTTNPIVRKDGAVVMGRGIAKEMIDRYPDFAYDFGTLLHHFNMHCLFTPPVAYVGTYNGTDCGYFMVKDHWANAADTEIITRSTEWLYRWTKNRGRIDLNFPGIGNGKLKREDVLPIIEQLPDNVHVWEYE